MPSADDEVTEYRVDFSIFRRRRGEEGFTEIGSESTGAWGSLRHASHVAASALERSEEWLEVSDDQH